VDACRARRFHVWAVDTVQQALEILTGRPAGERDRHGCYPEDSLLRIAAERAADYWLLVTAVSLGGESSASAAPTAGTTDSSLRGILHPAPPRKRRKKMR
jgi:hypothetical protein